MKRIREGAIHASVRDPKTAPRRFHLMPIASTSRRAAAALTCVIAIAIAVSGCSAGDSSDSSEEDRLASVRELQASGQIPASIEVLREMIAEGDRRGEVMYRYGRALSLSGQPGRGIWALEEALTHEEWFVNASQQIALDAFQGDNQEVALEALERLKSERPDEYAEDLQVRLLELRIRTNTRRMYDECLALADEILEENPDHEFVMRLKAVALLGLKQPDAAYEIIRNARLLGIDGEGDGEDDATEALLGDVDAPQETERVALDETASDAARDAESDGDETAQEAATEAYWCTVRVTFKREAGELAEAATLLDECLEKYPADTALLNEVGKLYPLVGRTRDIETALVAAVEADPSNDDLRMNYVRLLDSAGRADDAEQVLRDAIERARQESTEGAGIARIARSLVNLGAFLVDHDRGDEAIDHFGDAIGMLGRRAAPDLILRQAEALTLAGRFDEALALADQTSVEVHAGLIRGRVAFERSEYAKAVEALAEVARVWPDHAPTRYYLARAREGLGDFDLAIEEYRQAIRTDAALSAPRERLARLHLAEGRVRQAATILNFSSPLQSSTTSGAMKLLQIETQVRMGREPDLRIPHASDLTLEELARGSIRAIARGISTAADPIEAEATLASVETAIADSTTAGFFLRARIDLLIEGGQPERAVEISRARVEARSADPHTRIALATALVAAGRDLAEARSLLVAEDAPDSNDASLVATLGLLEEKTGDDEAAVAAYARSLDIDEGYWPAIDGLVRTLVAAGRAEDADARLRSYLESGNPYEGRASLLYARRLGDGSDKERRVRYTQRALRFGGGAEALEYLKTLDPEIASNYRLEVIAPSAPTPSPAEVGEAPPDDAERTTDAG